MENQKKYISIYNIFRIILILSLFLLLISKCFADNEDSKKCVVYRNGKLMYNPDNPKIHCDTLQLLDNYWNGTDVNVPNQNKKPEEFAEILTEKEIISNGRAVCKNPSASNAKFTAKDAIEGETINGTCNVGYTGTVSATCQKDGKWTTNGKCLGSCTNLSNMYKESSFNNPTKSVTDSESVYSKCGNGYDGYKKYTCDNGRIKEIINTCALSMDYCPTLSKENGTITYTNSGAINSKATLECNTGYEIIGGNTTTKCNSKNETSGVWSTTLGNCTPKTCTNPTTQANANAFTKTSLKYNETAITATCKTGYNGSISASCDESGNWKYTGNCTIVRCPTTGLTIDNGSYPTISTANNSYNTTISGTCNTGYTGTISATCNASGVWVKSGSCEIILAAVDCGKGTLTGDKANGYCTYNYTGSQQTFSVTANVSTTIYLTIWGAQGGKTTGGKGGKSYGWLSLDSGTTDLYVYVGGQGQQATTLGELGAGGWNGGGNCYKLATLTCGGGGGATDIRKGGTDTTDRIIVAGGGGGGANCWGGTGGGGSGSGGSGCSFSYATSGTGGTSTGPGSGGTVTQGGCPIKKPGNSGDGPNGGDTNSEISESRVCYSPGAGGGGYYGGGSGPVSGAGPGGGGGSGYVGGVKNGSGYNGAKEGDGLARICWGSYADSSNCPGL